ncbi:MAG: RadC family protein [bacterium]|jgi:DNA repair protein RadC
MNCISKDLAEIKVSYHPKKSSSVQIGSSHSAQEVLRSLFDPDIIQLREEFLVLYLNRSNYVLGWSKISSGGLTGTVADPRLILGIALKSAAVSIILCHNHPSGNTKPSNADREITDKLKEAGRYMDINILDHIILTDTNYLSFADEGLI